MKSAVFDNSVDKLATLAEEGARASKVSVKNFFEPAQGTLRRATGKRHHIVFGRRGSGKSSLLYKTAQNLADEKQLVCYVDLEPFKGHHYPDVLLSVLLVSLVKLQALLENRFSDSVFQKVWSALSVGESRKRHQRAKALKTTLKTCIEEIKIELYANDGANLVFKEGNKESKGTEKKKVANTGFNLKKLLEGKIEEFVAEKMRTLVSTETTEETRRSKIDFLKRKTVDLRAIFSDMTELCGVNGYLFLDDLYHILRSEQPRLVDYFHSLAKGNGVWLKIGTIKHRSTLYLHAPQPIGLKIGDDADDINLDLTLEKFAVAKDFLAKILSNYISEAKAPSLDGLITEGGMERLVIASGGVPRDFLGLFRRSIDEARERLTKQPNHSKGAKITAEDVNMAAGAFGDTKREEFQKDTLEDQERLDNAFEKIKKFCLVRNKSNVFLIEQDASGIGFQQIEELIDLRLVHHVRSRVTISSRAGMVYRALLLDVSQYTGERKRRDIEMVEFWKNNRDAIRKTSLIYDPDMDLSSIEDISDDEPPPPAAQFQQPNLL